MNVMAADIDDGDDSDSDQRDSKTSSLVLIYTTREIKDIDEMCKSSKFRERIGRGDLAILVRASSSRW
jgi:hypothetical protein